MKGPFLKSLHQKRRNEPDALKAGEANTSISDPLSIKQKTIF